jgi:hypothetical protein
LIFVSPSTVLQLQVDTRREHALAQLAWPLMGGTAIGPGWVRLDKNNTRDSQNDDNQYETDWVLTSDGQTLGYLDSEEKLQWKSGPWPYRYINVAKHPMRHWQDNRITGRETNKMRSFRSAPKTSFWVGARTDYRAAIVLPVSTLLSQGVETQQPTRYSATPLPVIQVASECGIYCDTPETFAAAIIQHLEETCEHQD